MENVPLLLFYFISINVCAVQKNVIYIVASAYEDYFKFFLNGSLVFCHL